MRQGGNAWPVPDFENRGMPGNGGAEESWQCGAAVTFAIGSGGMMIQLLGSQEGREAEAARDLRDVILASWPWVEKHKRAVLSLVAGVKCHGQKRRDVDIVLLATFVDPVRFTPFLDISWGSGPPFRPKEAFLDSLCVTIEVKEQDSSGVRFTGAGRVDVRYIRSGGQIWSSATDQSEEQILRSQQRTLSHNPLIDLFIGGPRRGVARRDGTAAGEAGDVRIRAYRPGRTGGIRDQCFCHLAPCVIQRRESSICVAVSL